MLFAVLFVVSLAGPPAVAAQAHILRWTDGIDVQTLNPLFGTSGNVTELSQLTMAHFTRFDTHGALVPELITEIPTLANGGIGRDGKSIVYHLRRGVRWSDGAPFDADDVVYTVGVILNRDNNITSRDAWDHLAGVKALDKYTVAFQLKTPYASFASSFFGSFSTSCVLPKHLLGARASLNDAPYNALPVGIGPFRYTAFRRADAVEMEANPNYFRGVPKLTKIVYKIITEDNTIFTQLQTGEVDMWSIVSGNFVDRVQHIADVRVTSVLAPFITGIYFNDRSPVGSDRAVRLALRLATDRKLLLRNVFHNSGSLAESVVPRVSIDFDATLPQAAYDPAAAEQLLDAAGWKRGPDGMRAKAGVPLAIDIAIPSGYTPASSTAEVIRASWGKIGVGVAVKAYASGMFFGQAGSGGILSTGKFGAAILSLPGEVLADVAAYYGCAYAPPNGFNETRYCNRTVDAAMGRYVRSYQPGLRATLARRFQRLIDADAPGIVIYERAFAYAFGRGLTNFHPTAFGPFDNFLDVDMVP